MAAAVPGLHNGAVYLCSNSADDLIFAVDPAHATGIWDHRSRAVSSTARVGGTLIGPRLATRPLFIKVSLNAQVNNANQRGTVYYMGSIIDQATPAPAANWPSRVVHNLAHANRPYRARLTFMPAAAAPIAVMPGHAVYDKFILGCPFGGVSI